MSVHELLEVFPSQPQHRAGRRGANGGGSGRLGQERDLPEEADRLLYRLGIFSGYLQKRKVSQIADRFEENCAETAAARSVAALLDRLLREGSVEEDSHATVRSYYQKRHDKAQRELTTMATDYPEYVARTQEYLPAAAQS